MRSITQFTKLAAMTLLLSLIPCSTAGAMTRVVNSTDDKGQLQQHNKVSAGLPERLSDGRMRDFDHSVTLSYGILMDDGILMSDGILMADGILMGDLKRQANYVLVNGYNMADMP